MFCFRRLAVENLTAAYYTIVAVCLVFAFDHRARVCVRACARHRCASRSSNHTRTGTPSLSLSLACPCPARALSRARISRGLPRVAAAAAAVVVVVEGGSGDDDGGGVSRDDDETICFEAVLQRIIERFCSDARFRISQQHTYIEAVVVRIG